MEEKYDGTVTFKIGEVARRANVNKKTLLELIDSCAGDGPKGECPILGALEGESETGKELR